MQPLSQFVVLQLGQVFGEEISATLSVEPNVLVMRRLAGLVSEWRGTLSVPGISSWDCFTPHWPSSCATC